MVDLEVVEEDLLQIGAVAFDFNAVLEPLEHLQKDPLCFAVTVADVRIPHGHFWAKSEQAGALPEVCGDAARYFDPAEPEEIAAGTLDVLASPGELAARGLAHARAFTWDECARRHDEVYEELSVA